MSEIILFQRVVTWLKLFQRMGVASCQSKLLRVGYFCVTVVLLG